MKIKIEKIEKDEKKIKLTPNPEISEEDLNETTTKLFYKKVTADLKKYVSDIDNENKHLK